MKGRRMLVWAFVAYCALMVWLLFGRPQYRQDQMLHNLNLVPMKTICRIWVILSGDYALELQRNALVNLVGNVVMFVPLGFFASILWRSFRPLWRCVLLGGGMVVCVELTQLAARVGSCDLDDLLLNLMGIGMGYGLMCLVKKLDTPS